MKSDMLPPYFVVDLNNWDHQQNVFKGHKQVDIVKQSFNLIDMFSLKLWIVAGYYY